MTPLNQIVSIRRRCLRSINIVRDQNNTNRLDGYIVTPLVVQSLALIEESFAQNITDRAFTLTGPYGTGKSCFALLLDHLLQDKDGYAWKLLRSADKSFADKMWKSVFGRDGSSKGFLVLPVTAHRAPVTVLLAEAFDKLDFSEIDFIEPLIEELRSSADTKTSVRLVEKIATIVKSKGYSGIFFIFDEFGKVFEEAYYNKGKNDINLLQELSEAAARSAETPILFLGILHQGFENYVDDIRDTKTKNEFSKIQGRFTPMSFVEPPVAQLKLLSASIECDTKKVLPFKDKIDHLVSQGIKLSLHSIAGFSQEEYRSLAFQAWPFHPLAWLALPLLFRRFGQNERSIFTFLASNEPLSFQSFINTAPPNSLLGLDWLFDYLITNYESQLSYHPQGVIFLEANDILNSKNLSPVEQKVVKTVAILSSLGKQSSINASSALIQYAIGETGFDLQKLLTQSILVYRRFSDSYCVWEGSDVDLLQCAEKAERALGRTSFSLAEPLQAALPPRPIIAKRHSFYTGALRYFTVDYVDSPDEISLVLAKKGSIGNACGRIIICFSCSDATMETFADEAKRFSIADQTILFAIPQTIDELREALYEVQRLKWIVDNTEELRDDRIAQREVDLRMAEAKQKVAQLRISLTDPRPAPLGCKCQWIWNGNRQEMSTGKDVSILLSNVCDAIYPESPCILNEMINRRTISGQAAAARNNIIKRLIHQEYVSQEFLGIVGFPPDRSIYEGLLMQPGIHRQNADGTWDLAEPKKNDSTHLYAAWKKIDELVFSANDPVPLNTIYDTLRKAPYGVLDGIMPILLTAFYVINRKEVTLYQEGTFLPDPQDAHFELMVRRPDLFSIAGARIVGMRRKIVERLALGLKAEPAAIDVVRHLYRMLQSLSKYARNTNSVSAETSQFRQAFDDAKSPEKLLFVDLPTVFNLPPITEKDGSEEDFEIYFEKLNHSFGELAALLPELLKKQRGILLNACRLPDSKEGWITLYDRACFLAPKVTNTELIPFLQNITNTMGDWNKADAVIGYMVSVPLSNWSAMDVANFPGIAEGKAQLFLDAYRPYAGSFSTLTKAEQKQVDQFKKAIKKHFPKKQSNAVIRAALLACIEELEPETDKQ